ncbi:MAG: [FeFe] hydrogenase H-cluster radical SAM maturase HydE [Vampirovibrionia bacterium]
MVDIHSILDKEDLSKDDIIYLLELTDKSDLDALYDKANKVRQENVGDIVHVRGIIEFSNYCARWCSYCGINANNSKINRYRMSVDEIVETAYNAHKLGYKTVVLQSGEDCYYSIDVIESIIRSIKEKMDIFITLGLGERPDEEFERMKQAGADRYLIKHETSDRILYNKLHPDMYYDERIRCLKTLKKLGFELGSGIMIGLPGQTVETLADDILLFKELKVDMIGMGPYMPHPDTALYDDFIKIAYFAEGKDYDLEEMVYKMLATTRIVNKNANLPATTALAATNPHQGRQKALLRGANVLMPNVTSLKYREMYEIYPAKSNFTEPPENSRKSIDHTIVSVGRIPL